MLQQQNRVRIDVRRGLHTGDFADPADDLLDGRILKSSKGIGQPLSHVFIFNHRPATVGKYWCT